MNRRRFFIRNIQAGDRVEIFIILSVATILCIRGYLSLTGYPQLGNDNLHIAHMLPGGLMMMASIIVLLVFLSKAAQAAALFFGAIGFGFFIDEVGKFVTQDNDYFFQPSVAIMYVIFILIYLSVRAILTRRQYSQAEYLMNAIRDLEEIAFHDLDAEERDRILGYLEKSDYSNPLVSDLKKVVEGAVLVSTPKPNIFERVREWANDGYRRVSTLRGFDKIIIALFIIAAIASFSYVISVVLSEDKEWIKWVPMLSSSASALLILGGVFKLRRSRLKALRLFEWSILISIFFTQVFVFYRDEFGALVGLTISLLMLMAIRFMIEREQEIGIGSQSDTG